MNDALAVEGGVAVASAPRPGGPGVHAYALAAPNGREPCQDGRGCECWVVHVNLAADARVLRARKAVSGERRVAAPHC